MYEREEAVKRLTDILMHVSKDGILSVMESLRVADEQLKQIVHEG